MNNLRSVAISVRGVRKKFASGDIFIEVLKGVDLEAYSGEMLMITGPSGSGKTTLLSIIAGTLRADSGEVEVLGQSISDLNEDEVTNFRGKHIGFIFQRYHLIKTLTALRNVSIPQLLNGLSKKEAEVQASAMLKNVGLEGKGRKIPSHLSGGEQQRVAIARALIHHPAILLCDEPTAALDAENGDHVVKLMKELGKAQDRCIIVVTHDNRIFKYADRIVRMEDGLIVG